MPPPLTDDEFHLFAEWLAGEFGLRFGPEKREILRARLEPRRAALNLPSFEQLLFRVRYHPSAREERLRLVSHLTNNESYFFRERGQLDVLRREVLPGLARAAQADGRTELRILSAGSASGEEAYTLASVAMDALRGTGLEPVITGVDVDGAALERARTAVFRAHAFRGVEPETRSRLFTPEGSDHWRLKSGVRAAARFQQGNLVDPGFGAALPRQDVAFCRNVLIYFDEAGIRRAVDNLYAVLRPGGYLFLGHSETLSRIPTRFAPERRPGAIFYSRPKE